MSRQSKKISLITEIILGTFRLNGCLLEAGNDLVGSIGLTSARWQVVGVLTLNDKPMTISQIAKDMGLSRQAVQRTVNRLLVDKLLESKKNPYHKSSNLLVLTPKGNLSFKKAMALHQPWASQLAKGISIEDMQITLKTMQFLQKRLK